MLMLENNQNHAILIDHVLKTMTSLIKKSISFMNSGEPKF